MQKTLHLAALDGCGWKGDCHKYTVTIYVYSNRIISARSKQLLNKLTDGCLVDLRVSFLHAFFLADYLRLRGWGLFASIFEEDLESQDGDSAISFSHSFPTGSREERIIEKISSNFQVANLKNLSVETSFTIDEKYFNNDVFFGKIIRHIERTPSLVKEIKNGIVDFYNKIDYAVETSWKIITEDGNHEGWKISQFFNMWKTPQGNYSKDHMTDLFDFIFGKNYEFSNQDIVTVENNVIKIPNYWIKTSDFSFFNGRTPKYSKGQNFKSEKTKIFRQKETYIGKGCRTQLIEWGVSPYPWAMLRSSKIERTVDQVIREEIQGKKYTPFKEYSVYIVALVNGKAYAKKLSKNYFQQDSSKLDILCSLAIGELEAHVNENS